MGTRWLLFSCGLICSLCFVQRVRADLALDATFAAGGIAGFNVNPDSDVANDVAVQSDGKYVLSGTSEIGPYHDEAALVRLNDDGTPDLDFADAGLTFLIESTPGTADARAVAIQPEDQKILVAGTANVDGGVFVVRLLTDGTPDPDFGDAGVATVELPLRFAAASETNDIALQSNGAILVCGGLVQSLRHPQAFVLRLTPAGALDPTFATDGVFTMQNPTYVGSAFDFIALAVDEADAIVATASTGDVHVVKLSADGEPDSGFDGDGLVTLNYTSGELNGVFRSSNESVEDLALQTGGKILIIGSTLKDLTTWQEPIFVARLTSSGALDSTFGDGGWVFPPDQADFTRPLGAVVRASGDLIVAGVGFNPVQISPNGKAFSSLTDAIAPYWINALSVLDDGRVVGAGTQNVRYEDNEMVAVRFDVTDLADPSCEGPDGGALCGDLSGDCAIEAADALAALRMVVGATPTDFKADVDGDGSVTASDALKILRIAAGVDEATGACNT